jgi:hypothetical protein
MPSSMSETEFALFECVALIFEPLIALGIAAGGLEGTLQSQIAAHQRDGHDDAIAVLERLRAFVVDPQRQRIRQAIRQPGPEGTA